MMTTESFCLALLVGVGATVILDIWAELLKLAARIPPTNWCLVGRWFAHMPGGVFTHANIATANNKPYECAIGWIAHYAIGATYGVILVALVSAEWLTQPTVLPALLFGIVTMVFPLFVMQPSFGMGIASAKAPAPMTARLKTLVSHSVFGIGMYLTALVIAML